MATILKLPKRRWEWCTSVHDNCWVIALWKGPETRMKSGGMITADLIAAIDCGASEALERSDLEWYDTLQRRWRDDWPKSLWPDDKRLLPPIIRAQVKQFGLVNTVWT